MVHRKKVVKLSDEYQNYGGQILAESNGFTKKLKCDDSGILLTQTSLQASTSNIGIVNVQTLSGVVLNVASTTIIATTTSVDLTVGNYKELAVDVNISVVTGTTPTYTLAVDRLGADGVYYTIYTGTAITAVGVVSVTVGVGAVINTSFGNVIRVREIVGGTTPSYIRSISIVGK